MICRSCGGTADSFLDLGHQPPSDNFLSFAQLSEPETFYPLEVFACKDCALIQIGYVVPPDELFNKDYPYETGVNVGGVRHFAKFANDVSSRFNPNFIIDIGSNDGTLLSGFKGLGCKVLGIEPCTHIALKANKSGITTVPFFWGDDFTFCFRYADVITATNVFAHIPDLHAFIRCVDRNLTKDGVFIVENPYWPDTVDSGQYDQIYHEHLYYWSLGPIDKLMGMFGMEVFDMQPQTIHGGSMRYFIGRKGRHQYIRHNIKKATERELNVDLDLFAGGVIWHKMSLNSMLDNNFVCAGIGAAAKGNTLINYCEVDLNEIFEHPHSPKIGKFSPGRHIPVISEVELDGHEHLLILAHNWADEIIFKLRGLGYKGRFIVPFPEPRII